LPSGIPVPVVCDDATLPSDVLKAIASAGGRNPTCLRLRPNNAPIAVFTIDGRSAFKGWTAIRAVAPRHKLWPVMVGGEDEWSRVVENASHSRVEPADVLREAESIQHDDWLKKRTDYVLGIVGRMPEDGSIYPPHDPSEPDFAAVRDLLTGDYLSTAYVAVVPATDGPDVAATLLFGCWNDNPCPAEHVVVLRHWRDTYGAEVVSMTGEVLELLVRRPPSDWKSSLALAREMYAYDYDIVDQGTDTINALANVLQNGPSWYFWWD
jgi:hypothetical protein